MKWIIWLVAIASTSALVALWFWEVRRLLRQHRSMVESARCQLAAFEKRAAEAAGNADVAEVLRRSESITGRPPATITRHCIGHGSIFPGG